MRYPNIDKITTFRDLFSWIAYDIDDNYNLTKDKEGNFFVNKLYIEPQYLTYKTECAELAEGLFEKVQELYQLMLDD